MKTLVSLLLKCLDILGINAVFRFINRDKTIILWYHGIRDNDSHVPETYRRLHIRESIFRMQLSYLRQWGYSFVNMSELAGMIKAKARMRKLAVVTFDDGYENIVRQAYPIMKEFDAKGCLYIVSRLVDTSDTLWTARVASTVANSRDQEFVFVFKGEQLTWKLDTADSYLKATRGIVNRLRMLTGDNWAEHFLQIHNDVAAEVPPLLRIVSAQQILTLDKQVLEVGSHTRNHPDCTRLASKVEFHTELVTSRTEIGRMLGYEVRHFCYPFGSYDSLAVAEVKNAGYETAVTSTPGFVDKHADLFRLKRIGAAEDLLLFKAMTSGAILPVLRSFTSLRQLISRHVSKI